VTLFVTLAPPQPEPRVSPPVAAAVGLVAGVLLFITITRRPPWIARRGAHAPRVLVRVGFLGLWAASEEVLWRRVALGELLRAGTVPALATSTIGFALAHRRGRLVHVGTGGTFGALYLSTGVLATSIAAHWAYNLLVAELAEGDPPRGRPP
jgi:membrane protease YdiL (CAAX protease family)